MKIEDKKQSLEDSDKRVFYLIINKVKDNNKIIKCGRIRPRIVIRTCTINYKIRIRKHSQ